MNNLLVTGGAGFIGASFAQYWLKNYSQDNVIILDKLTYAGNIESLASVKDLANFRFYHGDINDSELVKKIFTDHNINQVINFAAESHVDNSIRDSYIFMQTNIMGTHHLLSLAKYFWLEKKICANYRFHQISTDEVFGSLDAKDPAFVETKAYETNSPYSASKAAADHIVRAFHNTYGLPISISHCSNNYGPFQNPEKLIPLSLLRILQGKTIPIYGDGQQIRDWLHVEDHCRALDVILKKGKIGHSYNIGGSGGEVANLHLIHSLCQVVDELFNTDKNLLEKYPYSPAAKNASAKSLIQHVTDRLGHDRRYAINSQKIQKELNFKYQIPLERGLKETIAWYLKHDNWWQPLI